MHVLFGTDGLMEKRTYLSTWKDIPSQNEVQSTVSPVSDMSTGEKYSATHYLLQSSWSDPSKNKLQYYFIYGQVSWIQFVSLINHTLNRMNNKVVLPVRAALRKSFFCLGLS